LAFRLAKRLDKEATETGSFDRDARLSLKAPTGRLTCGSRMGVAPVSGPEDGGLERDPGPLLATCLRGQDLGRDRNGSHSTQCLRESGEHHEVSMKLDALQPTDAERREAVLVLEPAEFALDSGARRDVVEGASRPR
jgi:hypothetical protein